MIYHIYLAKDRDDGYDSYFAVAADSSHFYVTAEFLAEDDWPDFEEHRHRLHQYKPDVSRMRWPELVRTTADLIDDKVNGYFNEDFMQEGV